jgi:hypothetical protein
MALINEQTVHLRVSGGDAAAPPQVFKRCEQVSDSSAFILAISRAFPTDGERTVDAAS